MTYQPIFPLHTLLFPKGLLTLQIFEPRYLDMVSQCLREDSGFVVALIRDGDEVGELPDIFPVGTFVRIIDWDKGANGLLNIVIEGQYKVRITETRVRHDLLMEGETEQFPAEEPRILPPEFDRLKSLLEKLLSELGSPYDRLEPQFDDAAWVAGRLIELLPLKPEGKYELFTVNDPMSRLFMLRDKMIQLEVL